LEKKLIDGKPGSLTSIAFNTGRLLERERIIKILEKELDFGRPAVLKKKWIIALIKKEK
jgi:hypothetical protein